ncbi:MAG: hypothetical protein HQM09_18630 [Candidatus Riflebacteria bacterium]|nr:hypothetical protein [Candidatus Riflebacteria bacterium]
MVDRRAFRKNSRGMILGIILLILIIIGVFFFSNQFFARQQLIKNHHGKLSEMASILAVNGCHFAADCINFGEKDPPPPGTDIRTIFRQEAADLFKPNENTSPIPDVEFSPTGNFCKTIRDAFQTKFLCDYEGSPSCSEIHVKFRNIRLIHPRPDNVTSYTALLKLGRDIAEKQGEVEIDCSVVFSSGFGGLGTKIKRQARVLRHFKVVSMIPGPYCRFTLFSPYTPDEESFNVVSNKCTGEYFPASPKRLVLINGTDTCDYYTKTSTQNDSKKMLQNSGWVFLGPPSKGAKDSIAAADRDTRSVLIKIPAGYDPNVTGGGNPFVGYPSAIDNTLGGDILLENPIPSKKDPTKSVTQDHPYTVPGLDPSKFDALAITGGFYQITFNDNYEWFKPQAGNAAPLASDDFRSSWIMPYGTKQYISRTLMVGNVLADFLRFIQIRSISDPQCQFTLNPEPDPPYGFGANPAMTDPPNYGKFKAAPHQPPPTYGDLFPTPFTPPVDPGYLWSLPSHGNFPIRQANIVGVPFNLVFETMSFSSRPDYDTWAAPELDAITDKTVLPLPQSVGSGDIPQTPETGAKWKNIAVHSDFRLWLNAAPAPTDPSNYMYFNGNLLECIYKKVPPAEFNTFFMDGLGKRVTHIIETEAGVNPMFALLNNGVLQQDSSGAYYEFKRPGIYLIRSSGDLSIDKPIKLKASGILILSNGDLSIKGVDSDDCDPTYGISNYLFSLVSLNGQIKVPPNTDPSKPIHAYLVSLNPAPDNYSSTGAGGSILNSSYVSKNPASKLFVSGGVAAFEIADPTLKPAPPSNTYRTMYTDFNGGGIIRYNPLFNPCAPPSPESHQLVLNGQDQSVSVIGSD